MDISVKLNQTYWEKTNRNELLQSKFPQRKPIPSLCHWANSKCQWNWPLVKVRLALYIISLYVSFTENLKDNIWYNTFFKLEKMFFYVLNISFLNFSIQKWKIFDQKFKRSLKMNGEIPVYILWQMIQDKSGMLCM